MSRTASLNYCACILVLASLTGVVCGGDLSPNKKGKEKRIDNNEKLSETLEDINRFFQKHRKLPIPVNQRSTILEALRVLPQKALDQNNLVSEQTIQKCSKCATYLSSNDLGLERLAQCQKIIAGCLPYLDVVSTKLAIKLVGQMSSCYDLQGQLLTADSIPAYRNIYLREKLRVWERVAALPLDPTWDPFAPENMVFLHVAPPSKNVEYMPGMPPECVKEPEIRKRYKAMIEANRKKMERHVEQRDFRDTQEDCLRNLKRSIVAAYKMRPITEVSQEDFETLKAYLHIYVSDENLRRELFEIARSAANGK